MNLPVFTCFVILLAKSSIAAIFLAMVSMFLFTLEDSAFTSSLSSLIAWLLWSVAAVEAMPRYGLMMPRLRMVARLYLVPCWPRSSFRKLLVTVSSLSL